MSTPPHPATIDRPSARVNEPQKKRRLSWLALFAIGLAAVLLYFTLRGLDWAAFWSTIKGGHYEFLLVIIPIGSANYFTRALRWSIFVRSQGDVPVSSVFWANMVGYMGNAYLPARAGELARSAFLGQKSGLGTSFVLATALAERLLDVIALVLIGSMALLLQANMSPLFANGLRVLALAGLLGLVIVVAAPFHEQVILRVVAWMPLPKNVARILSEQISRFLIGMRSLQSGKRLSLFVLLTFVIWFVDAIANVIGARVISQTLSIGQALVLLSALGLSSAIPSTPGYVGVYQFVAVTVLVPFGFSRADALAYILISQGMSYALVSFWGLLALWRINSSKAHTGTL